MNVKEYLKLLFAKQYRKRPTIVQRKLFHNNKEITKFFINFVYSKHKIYSIIRNLNMIDQKNVFYTINQKGFNTMLFKIRFDIAIADKNGKVIELFPDCKLNYISKHYENGYYVYFLPKGFIDFYRMKKSDLLAPGIKYLKDLDHIDRF